MSSLVDQARLRVPKFAEEAVERARLVVVPRRRRERAPRVPFAILVGLVLLGGVAGLLLFNTHMQKGSFHATALQERAAILNAEEQQLRMELDRIRDPQELAVRAKHMGMVPGGPPTFIRLTDGSVTGKTLPPSPDDDFPVRTQPTSKPKVLDPDPVIVKPQKSQHGNGASAREEAGQTGTKNGHGG